MNGKKIPTAGGMPETLISARRIAGRVRELGEAISDDHATCGELTVLCVLSGAFIFTADLVRNLQVPCRIEFIRASSYGDRRDSSGTVSIRSDNGPDLGKRHVLLVEDIVDTGLTLSRIAAGLMKQQPASLKVCCLPDKPTARKIPFSPDYTGFTIPDTFVVGYGLDAAGRFRELPYIGIADS